MPSTSAKQARFMAACAHGAGYSSCPPMKVSKEFNQADKGTSIRTGRVANKGGPETFSMSAKGNAMMAQGHGSKQSCDEMVSAATGRKHGGDDT